MKKLLMVISGAILIGCSGGVFAWGMCDSCDSYTYSCYNSCDSCLCDSCVNSCDCGGGWGCNGGCGGYYY